MLDYMESKKESTTETTETTSEPTTKPTNKEVEYIIPEETTMTNQSSARWTSPYNDNKKWVTDMTAAYKKAGLSDNAIKNLIAKNSLESSWGTSA
jgi:hypothetical protein